jgi:peptidoglycan/xylan/chitin deacetylase (PgdA/CDA1 family)
MGVDGPQAFPARFAELAGVEAFTLALPGYNLANQLAALEFFRDRLEPDAVVFAPTPNDADSTGVVLPNGSLGRVGLAVDRFDPASGVSIDAVTAGQNLAFHTGGFVDSHLFRTRWRRSFERLADLDRRLEAAGVPVAVFFTGTWNRDHAHRLMIESEVDAPYALTPPELTGRGWRNPPPVRHPNPEAHALYARIVYRLLAGELGWDELPPLDDGTDGGELAEAEPIHHLGGLSAAERRRHLDASHAAAAQATERSVPPGFRPGSSTAAAQAVGPMDPATGAFGSATTVLVRRPEGASRLRATFEPVAAAPGFYPLTLEVEIPSPGGGVRRSLSLDASGLAQVELPLPGDLPEGWALDVVVRAPRSRAERDVLAGRSARLVALDLF